MADGDEEWADRIDFSTLGMETGRCTGYKQLASMDQRKQHRRRGGSVPKVEARSLVLHHGDRKWRVPTRDFETWGSEAPVAYLLVEPRPLGEPDPELRHLPCC